MIAVGWFLAVSIRQTYWEDTTVTRCVFSECGTGTVNGGGICALGCVLSVANCMFVKCKAAEGGCIYAGDNAVLECNRTCMAEVTMCAIGHGIALVASEQVQGMCTTVACTGGRAPVRARESSSVYRNCNSSLHSTENHGCFDYHHDSLMDFAYCTFADIESKTSKSMDFADMFTTVCRFTACNVVRQKYGDYFFGISHPVEFVRCVLSDFEGGSMAIANGDDGVAFNECWICVELPENAIFSTVGCSFGECRLIEIEQVNTGYCAFATRQFTLVAGLNMNLGILAGLMVVVEGI